MKNKEKFMEEHLQKNGWVKTDAGQWKICLYYESNQIIKTLHQAYKLQMKLDGLKAAAGIVE